MVTALETDPRQQSRQMAAGLLDAEEDTLPGRRDLRPLAVVILRLRHRRSRMLRGRRMLTVVLTERLLHRVLESTTFIALDRLADIAVVFPDDLLNVAGRR